MASVTTYERATGPTHRVRWREGGQALSQTFTDLAAAEQFRDLVNLHGGTPPGWVMGHGFSDDPGTRVTVREAFASFLESRVVSTSGYTLNRYRRAGDRVLIPRWGSRGVASITLDDVQALVNERHRAGASAKTVRNLHGVVYGLMQHARVKGWRADNPCELTNLPADRKGEAVEYLTPEQFATLLAVAPAVPAGDGRTRDLSDVVPMLLTAAGTGVRWGELTALTPRSVVQDHTGVRLRITQAWKQEPDHSGVMAWVLGSPKTTRSSREVYVAGNLAAMLLELAERDVPFLFTAPRGDAWRYPTFHEGRWRPIVDAARAVDPSIPDPCRFHFLRHSYAWWSLSAGADLASLQDQLGHESIQMTKNVYGGLNPLARAASAKWSAAVTDGLVPPRALEA